MYSYKTTRIIIGCLLTLSLCPMSSVLAAVDTDQDLVHYVLENLPRGIGTVNNFQCKITELIHDYSIQGNGSQQKPKEHDGGDYDICIRQLSFDNQGRGRMEVSRGFRDKEDRLQTITYESFTTWDGRKCIMYEPRCGDTKPRARIDPEPLRELDMYANFLTWYTDELHTNLTKVIESNGAVRVVRERQGYLRLSFTNPDGQRCAMLVDPNQGFSVIEIRCHSPEGPMHKVHVQYKQMRPGLWFPTMIQIRESMGSVPQSTRTLMISDIRINDPNIYDHLFKLSFEAGTYVYDVMQGKDYFVWSR